MPNRCCVKNCKGNHGDLNKCRIFRLPKDETERVKWMNVIPFRTDIDQKNLFVCERHWPPDFDIVKLPGGFTKPVHPPSIFEVPASSLPTPKPIPRKTQQPDQQLRSFEKKDRIFSFSDFQPDRDLEKKYENVILSRTESRLVLLFMKTDYSECNASIIVNDKSTLCSPLTLYAFKKGIRISFGRILNPNNGLNSYSQFFDAVHFALNYDHSLDDVVDKVVELLEEPNKELTDSKKAQKLKFLTRQFQLLSHKSFSVNDYRFAFESHPNCNYEHMRDFLVLPSRRKLQAVVSSTNIQQVIRKTFEKVKTDQQKNVFLLIDEVKIRPVVAYSGGILSGTAKNDPDSKATSVLGVMMKCLHGGPSCMLSVTPVHKLTAKYQFNVVRESAVVVESCGGIVLGSITDNHKINQHYCELFDRKSASRAHHLLDPTRDWFLLFDTVHLLKCVRNNWISEKDQKLSLDKKDIACFADVHNLYKAEKENILKTTPLTYAAVCPSRLQLQNVQHVLRVFNDKVIAALKLQGSFGTANFIQQILNWWNTVNVSARWQDVRMKDPSRRAQDKDSVSLQSFLGVFKRAESGQGTSRKQCLTHDTKKAIVQTTEGLIGVCNHLYTVGFQYVLLREIQSDRIEGEFSVYRQSTGANAFMTSGDVSIAFKKRLTRFAASFLKSIEPDVSSQREHTCIGPIVKEDAQSIELCISDVMISPHEERSVAYVAGWLERKCEKQLVFSEDEVLLTKDVKDFIDEVSRGSLKVPHACTYELVRIGLCFVKKSRHRACCRKRMVTILQTMESFYDLGITSSKVFGHLANVLLHGLHNLEKDNQKNATLLQTSIKKARMSD